jgi:tRNA (mo5U34)-methyltransferase
VSDASLSDRDEILAKVNSYDGWRHRIEVAPGIFTPGIRNPAGKLELLDLPEDLSGLEVLDVGAADGWYSFECERRGAKRVVAMDVRPSQGFRIAADLLGSGAEYVQGSIYDAEPAQFDVVLCINVLYHLKEPLRAIERLRDLCKGTLILSTLALDRHVLVGSEKRQLTDLAEGADELALMQYLPSSERYRGAPSYFSISKVALCAMLEDAGFSIQRAELGGDDRVFVTARAGSRPS